MSAFNVNELLTDAEQKYDARNAGEFLTNLIRDSVLNDGFDCSLAKV